MGVVRQRRGVESEEEGGLRVGQRRGWRVRQENLAWFSYVLIDKM